MMRSRHYVVWGVVCYLFFLLVTLPAQWVLGLAVPWLEPVQFNGVSGSLWSGGFERLVVGSGAVGPGRWRVEFASVLRGRLGVDFSLGKGDGWPYLQGRVGVVGFSGLFLEGVTLRVTVEDIKEFFPLVPPGSKGRIHGSLTALVVDLEGVADLRGQGEVRGLFVGAPLGVGLGDWRANLATGNFRGVVVRLADIQPSPLVVQLTARLQPDGHFSVRGGVTLKEPDQEQLANLLRLFGPMDANGRVTVNESGRLPGVW